MAKTPQLYEVAEEICQSRKFKYLEYIGKGTFKETYAVTNDHDVRLALKIAYPERYIVTRTEREIQILTRCESPLVCRLYECDQFMSNNGSKYFYSIEEFLDGGTLAEKMRQNNIELDTIRYYAISLAEAIGYLRTLNVVHRDIKPDNIMFRSSTPEPVLVDFNIVRDLSESSLTPTWVGQGPGTPLFSAPEQLNNEKHLIDWRTDQFSLGIVIGICTTGRHPFEKPGMNEAEIINCVARRDLVSEEYGNRIKELGFSNIIRMLNPWPIQRYQTIQTLTESFNTGGH